MSDDRLRQVETTLATLATEQRLTNKFMEGNLAELKLITKSHADVISDVHSRTSTLEDSREKKAKWTLAGATVLAWLSAKAVWDYFQHGGQ